MLDPGAHMMTVPPTCKVWTPSWTLVGEIEGFLNTKIIYKRLKLLKVNLHELMTLKAGKVPDIDQLNGIQSEEVGYLPVNNIVYSKVSAILPYGNGIFVFFILVAVVVIFILVKKRWIAIKYLFSKHTEARIKRNLENKSPI